MISIIIPAYREEKRIESCLRSVAAQTYGRERIETIVVDGDSPDRTREIAGKYADRVIRLKERGVGRARNAGARAAGGEILLFLDADTILDPSFVDRLVRFYSRRNVVCVSGALRAARSAKLKYRLYGFFHYRTVNAAMTATALVGRPLFSAVCCSCRHWAFDELGGFDEAMAIGEDLKFSLGMGKLGRCAVCRGARAFTSMRRSEALGLWEGVMIFFRNYMKILYRKEKPWIDDFPHID